MNLHPAIAISLPFLTGAFTAYLASKRGRSWKTWFCLGAFFGLLGTIFLYCMPDKSSIQKKEAASSTSISPVVELGSQKLWYYLDAENKQCGPISTNKLQEELQFGHLHKSTYVWNEEMEDWRKVIDLPDTAALIPTTE